MTIAAHWPADAGPAPLPQVAEAPPPERTYTLTKLASVRPRPITWLLPGRIPYGGLTILAGRPGQGKSQFTLALAAALTARGATDVILVGAEDGLEDTVRPRLMACGADVERVHAFHSKTERGIDDLTLLPTDVPLLEQAVKDTGAGLVVIDPFAAHLAPDLNSHSDHSLRQATAPLAHLARRTGVAVVVVAHFKKSREGSPMDWIGGSVGLTGAARSALLFGKDAAGSWEDGHKRYLCHVKCNGAPLAPTLECAIDSATVRDEQLEIPTSKVVMLGDRTDIWAGDLE